MLVSTAVQVEESLKSQVTSVEAVPNSCVDMIQRRTIDMMQMLDDSIRSVPRLGREKNDTYKPPSKKMPQRAIFCTRLF